MSESWVEIDWGALARNARAIRASLRPDVEPMGVVKSDAYGHGLEGVGRRLVDAGFRWMTTALVDEARRLREAVDEPELLVIGPSRPEDIPLLMERRITVVMTDLDHARRMAAEARRLGVRLPAHIKIDTGMGRLGVPWFSVPDHLPDILRLPGLEICGLCTHFATIEPDRMEEAQRQVRRFDEACRLAASLTDRPLFRHVSSSRAMLYHPEWDYEGVRPGIVLYGYGARKQDQRFQTQPILQWKTRVLQIKTVPEQFPVGYYSSYATMEPTDIATLGVGYADGFPRYLSNKGHVLIGGERRRVVGAVSMNWITVDLGPDSGVRAGDEAVLIGAQGEESIWADEISRQCRTIPYEVLTGIHAAVPRRSKGP